MIDLKKMGCFEYTAEVLGAVVMIQSCWTTPNTGETVEGIFNSVIGGLVSYGNIIIQSLHHNIAL